MNESIEALKPLVSPQQDEQDKLFNYNEAITHLKRLINDWKEEVEETSTRRELRDVEVDIESLRKSGILYEDETLVPVRVIDTNISRELPAYVNYIKNSRRICTFRSLDNPEQDTQLLEQAYTQGMTYKGWEKPLYKAIDGSAVHGWDIVEVVFDPNKPLHVGFEHVGHDQCFFPMSVKDIQQSPRIIRAYDVTFIQLRKWVNTYGFNGEQVDKLIDAIRETQKEAETIRIYKLFFKKDGVVYIAWFSDDGKTSDWLKAPAKLYLGISHQETIQVPSLDQFGMSTFTPQEQTVDDDITTYPLFLLPYKVTEKPKETDNKGRCFLDEPKQEAQTAVLSGFVNGLTRASNVFASPSQEDGSGASLKELELKLKGGRILNKPINFWHPDYPDPMVLKALQYFDVSNSQETNQVNFAAMNREDSRKTATEIGAAQNQQALLNSVQLTLFSTWFRDIHSLAWLIVQSQAMQNKIKFLQIPIQQPVINPLTNTPVIDPSTGQPVTQTQWVNNVEVIGQSYDVRAAGDVDVIQRQEKINMMMQDWPVIMNTPLRDRFLADLMKLKYPDTGEQYSQILSQAGLMQSLQSMVGRLSTVLQGAIEQNPEVLQSLPAQQQSDLASMMQEAKAMMGQGGMMNGQ